MGKPRYRCPDCERENLAVLEFYFDKSKPAGRSTYCRECVRRRQRERRQRLSARTNAELATARPDSQRCNVCHVVKNTDQFYNSRSTPSALRYACKECSTQAVTEWRDRNRTNKETNQ